VESSVKSCLIKIQVLCFALSALFLMGASRRDFASDERTSLVERTSALRHKIVVLKHEQDYLLFQKEMYSSDSKYLIMNFARRTGQLKYKNRVLMDFRFKLPGKYRGRRFQKGMLVLMKKTEGKNDHHTLAFGGRSFIMQSERTAVPAKESGIPAVCLQKKDMMSVYYALEEGALAYVIH
jgi:hypothetical protein